MSKIKYLFVFFAFFVTSCTDCDYSLMFMFSKERNFSELPTKVQKAVYKYCSDYLNHDGYIWSVDEKDSNRYYAEGIPPIFGPNSWVDHVRFIDKKKNIVYRIETATPSPYFVFEEKLYIPSEYNLMDLTCTEVTFSEYELK